MRPNLRLRLRCALWGAKHATFFLAEKLKKVSEYDQEIPQSYTTDQLTAPRGKATDHPQQQHNCKTTIANQPAPRPPPPPYPKMIAKLEWTQSNAYQNKDKQNYREQREAHQTIDQQQQNPRFRTDSSLSHRGGGGGLTAFHQRQVRPRPRFRRC